MKHEYKRNIMQTIFITWFYADDAWFAIGYFRDKKSFPCIDIKVIQNGGKVTLDVILIPYEEKSTKRRSD